MSNQSCLLIYLIYLIHFELILDPWSLILDPWSLILDPWSLIPDSVIQWSLIQFFQETEKKWVRSDLTRSAYKIASCIAGLKYTATEDVNYQLTVRCSLIFGNNFQYLYVNSEIKMSSTAIMTPWESLLRRLVYPLIVPNRLAHYYDIKRDCAGLWAGY